MVTAIVGANWGDEGKGKITDLLASESDIVIRFQGGANAGHTIINDHGRFALHLMPSGVCYDNIVNIIGNGVALDIRKFVNEYNSLKEQGLNPHLLVSDRVQVVMPYHVDFDKFEEERLGGKAFGSVSSKEIVKAITDQLGLDIDKKKLILPEPLKTFGTHEVPIRLHREVTAKLDVHVREA